MNLKLNINKPTINAQPDIQPNIVHKYSLDAKDLFKMIINATVISVQLLIISNKYVNELQHELPSITASHDDLVPRPVWHNVGNVLQQK